jgi:hypothetical protein
MTLSTDGKYLTVPGYNLTNGTASAGTAAGANRVIGLANANGTTSIPVANASILAGSNFRSVTSDGTNYWGAGTNGQVYITNGGTVNSTAFSGTSNNATNAFGKTESNLNVNNALTSNNSSYLGGTIAASYALLASPTFTGTVNVSSGSLYSNNMLMQGDGTNGYIRPINAGSVLYIGSNNTNQVTVAANGMVSLVNQIAVGTNVITNTTAYFVGNSSVNAYITSAGLYVNGAVFQSGAGYYKGNKGTVGDASNANNIFRINANTISTSITFVAGENASAVGPLTIGTGNTVTISTGARVVIV